MACLYDEEREPWGRLKERAGVKDGARPRRKQGAREGRVLETLRIGEALA